MKLAVRLAMLLPRVVRLWINWTVSTRALLMAMNISEAGEEEVAFVDLGGDADWGSLSDEMSGSEEPDDNVCSCVLVELLDKSGHDIDELGAAIDCLW
jgi:hypothetical protein